MADLTEELVTSPNQALAWIRKGESKMWLFLHFVNSSNGCSFKCASPVTFLCLHCPPCQRTVTTERRRWTNGAVDHTPFFAWWDKTVAQLVEFNVRCMFVGNNGCVLFRSSRAVRVMTTRLVKMQTELLLYPIWWVIKLENGMFSEHWVVEITNYLFVSSPSLSCRIWLTWRELNGPARLGLKVVEV